ncbi:MAG: hypothetical protein CL878_13345 [Dehalococcoidia bacterium]|nr:hypothetical protein [Dehalococcoidia bacterium]
MPKNYEDDIRDILDQMDKFLPEEGQPRQGRRSRSYSQRPRPAAGDLWRNFAAQFQGESLTPHKLMGGSVLLMLFGWVLSIFSPGLAQLCTIIAVAGFVIGLIWSIRSRGGVSTSSSSQQWWRGEVIEMPRRSWQESFRAWWRRVTSSQRRPPRDYGRR